MKITGTQVLEFLIPQGGWIISGDEYEGITFLQCEPITKEEFEAGFNQYESWKTQQESDAQAKRTVVEAKLAALGLNADDLKALGLT